MPYDVFLVSYLNYNRDHHAIFVETNTDKSGYIFQVVGSILNGMTFGHKEAKEPEKSSSFVDKSYLGTVSEANYHNILPTVNDIPPPEKQFELGGRINPDVPLRRCQEWTAEAIQALKDQGILEG